jgi:dipeptidyl aminopeptidase/acylaminoacyl peptidase
LQGGQSPARVGERAGRHHAHHTATRSLSRQPGPATVRPLRWVGLFATVLLLVACRSGSSPSSSGTVPAGLWLAGAEEHGDHTDLLLMAAAAPDQRRKLASVPHRANWGLRGSLAPDGRALVYTVLPRTANDPDTQGELWELPLGGRPARRLATGLDLRSSLVWSPDGQWVSYERVQQDAIELRRVNAGGAGDEPIVRAPLSERWYTMGYGADGGTVVLAHITTGGTEVVQRTVDGTEQSRRQVSNGSARGFTVSPDGRAAMLILVNEGGKQVYRAVSVGADGVVARLTLGGAEDTGIAWNQRTGAPTVGVVAGGGDVAGSAGAQVLLPGSGFDVPAAWSPDGAVLALRHFSGRSTDQPGTESIEVLMDQQRTPVAGSGPLAILGWVSR